MNEKVAKAQRRNLRQAIGEQAAAALVDVRDLATKTHLEHVVLAQQMLAFERDVAVLKEARARDLQTIAALRAEVERAHVAIGKEHTHRLKLAEEQRDYVDRHDQQIWIHIKARERSLWTRVRDRYRLRRFFRAPGGTW